MYYLIKYKILIRQLFVIERDRNKRERKRERERDRDRERERERDIGLERKIELRER